VYGRPPGQHAPWPIERHLALLDAHGIGGAVVVQPSFLGSDHGELVAALAVAPGRLRGVAVVDDSFSGEEMARLHEAGVRGIRLNFFRGSDADLTSAAWRRVIEMIEGRGWHLELNVREERMVATLAQLAGLSIPVTVDHIGRPDPSLGPLGPGFRALLDAATRQTIYVKLTAPYRSSMKAAKDCVTAWLATVGPHRALWGSDCPWVEMDPAPSYAQTLGWIDECIPSPQDRAAVLGLNAHTLFGFPSR
jgi:predicted TIM-barrel fold metal-dependent hydrolase